MRCSPDAATAEPTEKLVDDAVRLRLYDARLMRCYAISTRINHVANDGAECSAPVALTETQAGLFS
jgi:hypothetical protein